MRPSDGSFPNTGQTEEIMLRPVCILVFALLAPLQGFAQPSLTGTYKLVSNDLRLDGVPIQPMGKSQHGYLVITPKVMMAFFTADQRKIGATTEAKAALLDSLSAYAGPWRAEGDKIYIDIDTAWTEVWRGKQQVRTFEFDGRRLTLIVTPQPSATQPGKMLTSRSVWEKID
jgi:fumarate reductase subunit D